MPLAALMAGLLLLVPTACGAGSTGSSADDSKENVMDLTITANGSSWDAVLADTAAARAFARRLPLTLAMDDLNGNEKYHYLDHALPGEAQAVGEIRAGDLMLYGDDCVVLFYESFHTPYTYTRLGRLTDHTGLADAFGSGAVEVTFAAANAGTGSEGQ